MSGQIDGIEVVILVLLLVLYGCATPHLLAGDALVCDKGGEYIEGTKGEVRVTCQEGMRWTGPMSDKAATVSLEILKAATSAAPGVP